MEVLRGLPLPPPSLPADGDRRRDTTVASRVRALCPPLDEWRRFVYCTSMLRPDPGALIGAVDHFPPTILDARDDATAAADSPAAPRPVPGAAEAVAHLPQHRLLALLLQAAEHAAASLSAEGPEPSSLAPVWFGHEAVGLEEEEVEGGGVAVLVRRTGAVADGTPRTTRMRARFVVAADGARGGLRDAALRREGAALPTAMQHLINVHFTHPPLGRALLAASPADDKGAASRSCSSSSPPACPPAMLYFVLNADVVAVIVAHDLARGEFVAQLPYWPPLQDAGLDFSPGACAALVRAAVLPASSSWSSPSCAAAASSWESQGWPRVEQVRPWAMDMSVEERWAFAAAELRGGRRHGSSTGPPASPALPRFFLVGDSAHRFPPAGGFGMNTGIQDAHALAWRLALAVRSEEGQRGGGAPTPPTTTTLARLLHSYGRERRSVALANAQLSVDNWLEASAVPAALGLDPRAAEAAASAASAAASLAASALPLADAARSVARAALSAALAAGRAASAAALPLRCGAARAVLERGDSLRLQFPREDLGFCYSQRFEEERVGDDDDDGGDDNSDDGAPSPPKRGAPYVPSLRPGCRMPHAPVEVPLLEGGWAASPVAAAAASTLDFVAPRRGAAAPPRCLLVASGPKTQLQVALWAAECLRESSGERWPVDLLVLLAPGQRAPPLPTMPPASTWIARDVEGAWARLWQEEQGGVVLVRPDGHVAWRRRWRTAEAEAEDDERVAADALADSVRRVMRETLGFWPDRNERRDN
jgi:2-polyprenyl-6-methoxyphenol hydroxylase-like FAD-dependent oxidoreductase